MAYKNIGCRHLWCALKPGHAGAHQNRWGAKWSGFTCVDSNCASFDRMGWDENEFLTRAIPGDPRRWTPCCRNTRWWNPDGTLGGTLLETVFCGICKGDAGQLAVEPILRGKPRPVVFHLKCFEKKNKPPGNPACLNCCGAGCEICPPEPAKKRRRKK